MAGRPVRDTAAAARIRTTYPGAGMTWTGTTRRKRQTSIRRSRISAPKAFVLSSRHHNPVLSWTAVEFDPSSRKFVCCLPHRAPYSGAGTDRAMAARNSSCICRRPVSTPSSSNRIYRLHCRPLRGPQRAFFLVRFHRVSLSAIAIDRLAPVCAHPHSLRLRSSQ